jgi:hypothetical protein
VDHSPAKFLASSGTVSTSTTNTIPETQYQMNTKFAEKSRETTATREMNLENSLERLENAPEISQENTCEPEKVEDEVRTLMSNKSHHCHRRHQSLISSPSSSHILRVNSILANCIPSCGVTHEQILATETHSCSIRVMLLKIYVFIENSTLFDRTSTSWPTSPINRKALFAGCNVLYILAE